MAGAGQVADDHAEAVVERHRHADPVGLAVAEHLAAEEAVVQDVVVRQGRALGRAGGTRGVLDVDRVVERQATFTRRQPIVVDRRALLQQRRPLVVEDHPRSQRRALGADPVQNLEVVGLPEAARHHQQREPRLVQRVSQLLRLVGRVEANQDRADPGGGVLDDDPLEPVGGPDADPVARLDTVRQQRLGQAGRGVPELAVGGAIRLCRRHERLAVAVALDGASEIGADRLAQEGDGAGAVHVGRAAHGPLRRVSSCVVATARPAPRCARCAPSPRVVRAARRARGGPTIPRM